MRRMREGGHEKDKMIRPHAPRHPASGIRLSFFIRVIILSLYKHNMNGLVYFLYADVVCI